MAWVQSLEAVGFWWWNPRTRTRLELLVLLHAIEGLPQPLLRRRVVARAGWIAGRRCKCCDWVELCKSAMLKFSAHILLDSLPVCISACALLGPGFMGNVIAKHMYTHMELKKLTWIAWTGNMLIRSHSKPSVRAWVEFFLPMRAMLPYR